MSMRVKAILAIIVVFLLTMLAGSIYTRTLFMEGYLKLEETAFRENANRFEYILSHESRDLGSLTNDWAAWDDSYHFMLSRDPGYIESNLVDGAFQELGLNYILILNVNNDAVYKKAYDLLNFEEMSFSQELLSQFVALVDQHPDALAEGNLQGILNQDGIPLVFAMRPILDSEEKAPSQGVMVFAKLVQGDFYNHLASSLNSSFTIQPYSKQAIAKYTPMASDNLIRMDLSRPDIARVFSQIFDYNNCAAFTLTQTLPRTIYQQGLASQREFMWALFIGSSIASLCVIAGLEFSLLKRLSRVQATIKDYQGNPSGGHLDLLKGNDEIASLSRELHSTLQASRKHNLEMEALRDTIADITAELKLDKLLKTMLTRAVRLLGADGGDFCRLDEASGDLVVVASKNLKGQYIGTHIKKNEGASGIVLATRKPFVLDDYAAWPGRLDILQKSTIHAVIVFPLIIGTRVLGTLGITHSDSTKRFSKEDQHLLSLFAQHASIALENALLFERLQTMARIDEVSGLYNRRAFLDIGEYEVRRARRLNHAIALAMIDLDHFKDVNDLISHQAGDKALREIARICRENIRNIDIISRYGGDEFIILMPETNAKNARVVLERLRQTIGGTKLAVNGSSFRITASFGVAAFEENPPDLEEIINKADEYMYQAKKAGRNCIRPLL